MTSQRIRLRVQGLKLHEVKRTMTPLVRSLCLAAAAFMVTFATAATESPSGFRGITWGSAPTALGPDRVRVSSDERILAPGEECYTRPSELMELASQPLRRVDWCFYKGRLWQVTAVTLASEAMPEFAAKLAAIKLVVAGDKQHGSAAKGRILTCPFHRPAARRMDVAGKHSNVVLEVSRHTERRVQLQMKVREKK